MSGSNLGLNFPPTFCCNCGDTDCATEIQDTRVSRFLGFGGGETTFHLPIPVCAACSKTTRRRPSGWFPRLLLWVVTACVLSLVLVVLGMKGVLPTWNIAQVVAVSAAVALMLVVAFYRLRRPTPPQTSFYQPVRIRAASVNYRDDHTHVRFIKLAFTNHDYLNVFATANRDSIDAKTLVVVKA